MAIGEVGGLAVAAVRFVMREEGASMVMGSMARVCMLGLIDLIILV